MAVNLDRDGTARAELWNALKSALNGASAWKIFVEFKLKRNPDDFTGGIEERTRQLLNTEISHDGGVRLIRELRWFRYKNPQVKAFRKKYYYTRCLQDSTLVDLGQLVDDSILEFHQLMRLTRKACGDLLPTKDMDEAEITMDLIDMMANLPNPSGTNRMPPILNFAILVSKDAEDSDIKQRLGKWYYEAAAVLNVDERTLEHAVLQSEQNTNIGAAASVPCLIIQLLDSADQSFEMQMWFKHPDTADPEPLDVPDGTYTIDEVRRRIDVTRKRYAHRYDKLRIDMLLPPDMLLDAVETWTEAFYVQDQVTVRDSNRVYAEVMANMGYELAVFKRKWREIGNAQCVTEEQAHPNVIWIRDDSVPNDTAIKAAVNEEEKVGVAMINCCSVSQKRTALLQYIKEGIPVALVLRQVPQGCDAPKETQSLMQSLTALPDSVLAARRDAVLNPTTHSVGAHLTLVWDDPELVPPDALKVSDLDASGI